ncbi:ATP-binding protein [Flavobacterium sp. ST-75]|uniref:ATP-binding protein n=1 Tax=Flavobacterium rhizophilum TaxID=3163296 RepID=A0ABW8YI68_9FLAO
MLKSINIKNFKSVKDLKIELGRVNVFIGENGCGKTSILEGIALASSAISNKLDQEFLVSRGVRVTEPKLMKSAFSKFDKDNKIELSLTNIDDKTVNFKIDYKNKNLIINDIDTNINIQLSDYKFNEFFSLFTENEELKNIFIKKAKSKKEKNSDEITEVFKNLLTDYYNNQIESFKDPFIKSDFIFSHNHQLIEKFNFSNFLIYTPENYFLRRFEEEGQIYPIGIKGEGLFKHLVSLFKENDSFCQELCDNLKLINWFESLEVPSDLSFTEMRLNIKDKFLKDTIEYFDQRSANEGFLYLLFYFSLFLSNETPEFFAIDNIDNALNPKLCKELIERLVTLSKQKEKQVILTTHNPSILDGLDLSKDDQRLFVIYRNADGHTKAKRIKPPKSIDGINTVRLSEAFIRGYIGGLPKNF